MDYFSYKSGTLHCEAVDLNDIAATVGTPTYVYSKATLIEHYDRFSDAFAELDPLICYAIKSCPNLSVCKLLADRGAGMDVVSGGELFRALNVGTPASKCVYAGVGKTDAEIIQALDAGIGWFNIESEAEFENIARLARQQNTTCRAALRINPDVDPKTHTYTTTGKKETKFGVDLERARAFFSKYGNDDYCMLDALHLHIGSPVYTTQPYVDAVTKALTLIDDLKTAGYEINMLDLGGGFGADYETDQSPAAADYAAVLVPLLKQRVEDGLKIVMEPGRSIAANAGILLLRILYIKTSGTKKFIICDGGMNVLMRPCHYGAFHFAWTVDVEEQFIPPQRAEDIDLPGLEPADIVGPICESGDFLAKDRKLPPVKRGDLIAIFAAGAYGMSMANRYNAMPLPAEVLVDGTVVQLIAERETYDDVIAKELNPKTIATSESSKAGTV